MSITWNGVSSDTIGVVVERIPNRYVPTRRFSPQQVAGRNGNILLVDKAFPNVEQEYEVYLSAEAQGLPSVARACAEWLMGPDGYCRLTDSYDTTVYREAFLMGGYDLENILNKFGRCTITFSCKPQKYLLTGDTPIEIPVGTTTTYTGDVVQFDGVTGASITSLSTTLSPIQDLHDYSNPWPAGGGKQLLDPSKFIQNPISQSGIDVINNGDGTFTVKGTATATIYTPLINYQYLSDYEFIEPNVSYTLSGYYNSNVYVGFGISGAGTDYWASTSGGRTMTFTAEDISAKKYRLVIRVNSGEVLGDTGIIIKPMICKSSASNPSTFSPYSNICPISGRTGLSVYVSPTQDVADATTYAIDWTSEAGTVYGGTLDVVTGVLTVDRAYKAFDGTEDWGIVNNDYFMTVVGTLNSVVNDSAISTHYLDNPNISGGNYQLGFRCFNRSSSPYSGAVVLVRPEAPLTISLDDFKAWLVTQNTNGTPFAVCYELATPLTYQLTAQEVEALVGTNNVWSSSGDVSVTVVTPLGGIVTNPTPFEARPLLTVSGVGEITVNGKSIQILESVSDFEIDCETMEAEDNSKIYCMDFPDLSGGENEIVSNGSITSLTVVPRWWTL